MAKINGQKLNEVNVYVDGNTYEDCDFRECRIIYSGGSLPVFVRGSIERCEFVFDGAAMRTLLYMNALAKTDPALVTGMFQQIMKFDSKSQEDAPS